MNDDFEKLTRAIFGFSAGPIVSFFDTRSKDQKQEVTIMADEMTKARKLVALEQRATAATKELEAVSMELNSMDKDLKINGWDWNRPGNVVYISVQSRVGFKIEDNSTRPSR